MVSMAGFDLPVAVTRRYISSAITLIVHLARLKGGVRRVMRISEITALESGDYAIQDLFGFHQTGVDDRGIARGHFYSTGHKPMFLRRLAEQGIEVPARLFEARQLTVDSSIGPLSHAASAAGMLVGEEIA
jgi:pilus assembly protein CpaF